jgi:hypothetical protein
VVAISELFIVLRVKAQGRKPIEELLQDTNPVALSSALVRVFGASKRETASSSTTSRAVAFATIAIAGG